MNHKTSHSSTQAKCLQNGLNHSISFIRASVRKAISFIDNPRKHFKELLLRNESFRQTRREGRVSIALYVTALIIHTDLATGICGRPNGRGGIMPYSIEYIANYAGINVDIAKKWHSALSTCGYISNNKQISFDKRKGGWSSKPSIKTLSLMFYLSLGITKKLVDETMLYFKKKANAALTEYNSLRDYAITQITHIRSKFKKPEARKDTERIISVFIPKILKKF
jgi:hypothetical protein